jgi:hypothetical protein
MALPRPRAQYSHPQRQINKTEYFVPPRIASELKYWVRAVRKVFPEAPEKGYYQTDQIITDGTICLRFENIHTGDKYAFVIERGST